MEKKYCFDYEHFSSPTELPDKDAELVAKAREACSGSYSPYSNFKVGAAARLKSGKILTGNNQESYVFPAGLCAERNLLFNWQAHYTDDPIEAVAIASVPGSRECYPCGICRQTLHDTEQRQGSPIRVIMAGDTTASVVNTSEYLLPFTFKA